jgi:hypothetical protein
MYRIQSEKLESFGRAPYFLLTALKQFPRKMWLFEPAPNRWSIHKIILHLADSEANAYICCRRYIAEQGSLDLRFDSACWAETLGYCHQSTREALEIIRRLRKTTYGLLVVMQREPKANTLEQSASGELNLNDWLEHHHCHIVRHIVQMRLNYDFWRRAHPPMNPASAARRLNVVTPTALPAARI